MTKQGGGNATFAFMMLFLGIILGVGGYIAYEKYYVPPPVIPKPEISRNSAKEVFETNGLLVFINSLPARETELIAQHKVRLNEKIMLLAGLDKDGKPIKKKKTPGQPVEAKDILGFNDKLNVVLQQISEEYKDAECVVFSGRLDECDVYKFK